MYAFRKILVMAGLTILTIAIIKGPLALMAHPAIQAPSSSLTAPAWRVAVTGHSHPASLQQTISQAMHHGPVRTLSLTFLIGVFSSLFPCTLVLIPLLVSVCEQFRSTHRNRQLLFFGGGLASAAILVEFTLSQLGIRFLEGTSLLSYLLGLICIITALQLLHFLGEPIWPATQPQNEWKSFQFQMPQELATRFYILGAAFGLLSAPCGIPVLSAVLHRLPAPNPWPLALGILLFYVLGQSLLFLLISLASECFQRNKPFFQAGPAFSRMGGTIAVLLGLLFLLKSQNLWAGLESILILGSNG